MENYSTIYNDVQKYIKDYYFKHKKKITAGEAFNDTSLKESFTSIDSEDFFSKSWSHLSDEEFIALLYRLCVPKSPVTPAEIRADVPFELSEPYSFENNNDITAYKRFYYMNDPMHSHNYFEMFYIFKGNCQLNFEDELRTLSEGDFCIISPTSMHSIIHDDESSVIITISIRKSTFNSCFFPLLTQKDLLADFFRTILYNKTSSNYLVFSTENTEDIKTIIKNLLMEYNRGDIYSNNCCINLINLFFSLILRNYSESVQFHNYDLSTDFNLIMKYIQYNYHQITLESLATFFHYSKSNLSLLIKKNTGVNFIDLITNLKMSNASDLLKNTDISIDKISRQVGYNSSDHFSRTFKKHYNCSPQQYRKNLKAEQNF